MGTFYTCSVLCEYTSVIIIYREGFPFTNEIIIFVTQSNYHSEKKETKERGKTFLQMLIEYCDGGAVDSIMVELEKALTEMQIAYICQHMTKGLAFLHKSKVVHRDLKAGNVLLTMAGGVKIGKYLK